jgi:hypothetical protein
LLSAPVITLLALLTLDAASSPADVTVRADPGGAPLSGTTTLRSTTGSAAFSMGTGTSVNCSQSSLAARLTANAGSTSIGGTLTSLTFRSCTDTLPAVNIQHCAIHGTMPTVSLVGQPGGGNFGVGGGTRVIRCATTATPPSACYYNINIMAAVLSNAASTLVFWPIELGVATPTSDALPSASCGPFGIFLNTTFTHIVDDGNRTVTVTTT